MTTIAYWKERATIAEQEMVLARKELAAAKAAIDRVRLNFEWSTILTEREWKLIAKELCKAQEVKP